MLVHFSKMECLGQDFMVMDAVTEKIFPVAEKIQKWAQRCTGVGFSEFALVEPPYDPDTDFYFRVFSDTGQERQLSGHASLAMGRFVRDRRLINRPCIRAGYNGGLITLDVTDENVISVNMGKPVYDPVRLGFLFLLSDCPKFILWWNRGRLPVLTLSVSGNRCLLLNASRKFLRLISWKL